VVAVLVVVGRGGPAIENDVEEELGRVRFGVADPDHPDVLDRRADGPSLANGGEEVRADDWA
jgi:hypothetical protein